MKTQTHWAVKLLLASVVILQVFILARGPQGKSGAVVEEATRCYSPGRDEDRTTPPWTR